MTEGLFVLTTLFVAYVIYVIVNEKKAKGDKVSTPVAVKQEVPKATVSEKPKVTAPKPKAESVAKKPAAAAKKTTAAPVAVKPEAAVVKPVAAKPAPKKATATPVAVKPAAAAKPAATEKPAKPTAAEPASLKGTGLKDPSTGEVATAYSNYRFTKRWIKEALVAEKLVEKVYKNDELNASVEAKIKAGMIKLEGMKKYQP